MVSQPFTNSNSGLRAYELYEVRGREDGHDVEDLLLAEEDILGQKVRPKAA